MQRNKIDQILFLLFGILALSIILFMKTPVHADTVKTYAETIRDTVNYTDVWINKYEPFDYSPNKALLLHYCEGLFKTSHPADIWSEEFNELVEKWFFVPLDDEILNQLYKDHMHVTGIKLSFLLFGGLYFSHEAFGWFLWNTPETADWMVAYLWSLGPW
jgi:hypothetical protein